VLVLEEMFSGCDSSEIGVVGPISEQRRVLRLSHRSGADIIVKEK
jgi:hypothetical protein